MIYKIHKIRKGRDIELRWPITTNGEALPLEGRDIMLVVETPSTSNYLKPELTFEDNIVIFTIRGREQKQLGKHTITLWENYGKNGQTVLDCPDIIEFVPRTQQEGVVDRNVFPPTHITAQGNANSAEGAPALSSPDPLVVTYPLTLTSADISIGNRGADGVGISRIDQVAASNKPGGTNTFRIILTNGQQHDFSITNPDTRMIASTEWPADNCPSDNVCYHLGSIPSLTIAAIPDGNTEGVLVYFKADGSGFTINVPDDALWYGESAPVVVPGKRYVLLISDGIFGLNEINQF